MTIRLYILALIPLCCLTLSANESIEAENKVLKEKVESLEKRIKVLQTLLKKRRLEDGPPPMHERKGRPHTGKFNKKEGGAGASMPSMMQRVKQKFLKENDRDNNGELSEEERELAKESLKKAWEAKLKLTLEKFDEDKDGKLSKKEEHTYAKYRRAKFMEKFDENENDIFEKKEKKKAFEYLLENDPTEILLLHNLKIPNRRGGEHRQRENGERHDKKHPPHRDKE